MSETAPKNYVGKHKQLNVRSSSKGYKQHIDQAGSMFLETPVPGDKETLAEKRDFRELMAHDGTKTYLVHSTTPDQAQKILHEGLHALGTHDNPKLEATVVMLAGPEDKDQIAKNAFNLAYQYAGGDTGVGERTAKVVFEIPKPTPDIQLGRSTFAGTHLAEADGVNIINRGPTDKREGPDDTLYTIPNARAVGYIDLGVEGPAWQPNPEFEPQEPHNLPQAIGDMALRQ